MPDDLESRVTKLEELLTEQTNARLMQAAFLDALRQGLQEVLARSEISEELFLQRFRAVANWYYDRLLQKASDAAPNLAGEIDTRTIDQIPTSERPPALFPPDDPEG